MMVIPFWSLLYGVALYVVVFGFDCVRRLDVEDVVGVENWDLAWGLYLRCCVGVLLGII